MHSEWVILKLLKGRLMQVRPAHTHAIRGVMIPFFAGIGIGIVDFRFWNRFQYSTKIYFCRNWNGNQQFLKNDENPIQTPIHESES